MTQSENTLPPHDVGRIRRSQSWTDIRAEIMSRISSGAYAPGSLIPTEQELAAEFGCARATVNRALTSLAKRGVLQRRRRVGTRVALDARGACSRRTLPVFRELVESRGSRFGFRFQGQMPGDPPPEILEALFHTDPRAVMETMTLFYADDELVCVERRWHDTAALPDLAATLDSATSANEWIATNVPMSLIEQTITARTAGSAGVERFLRCDATAPVLVYETCIWTGSRPVSVAHHAFLPGQAVCTTVN